MENKRLLGWSQTEFEAHVSLGLLSVYAYYGTDRVRERRSLLEHDIVLTTYGVLASEWSQPVSPCTKLEWLRFCGKISVLCSMESMHRTCVQMSKGVLTPSVFQV